MCDDSWLTHFMKICSVSYFSAAERKWGWPPCSDNKVTFYCAQPLNGALLFALLQLLCICFVPGLSSDLLIFSLSLCFLAGKHVCMSWHLHCENLVLNIWHCSTILDLCFCFWQAANQCMCVIIAILSAVKANYKCKSYKQNQHRWQRITLSFTSCSLTCIIQWDMQ